MPKVSDLVSMYPGQQPVVAKKPATVPKPASCARKWPPEKETNLESSKAPFGSFASTSPSNNKALRSTDVHNKEVSSFSPNHTSKLNHKFDTGFLKQENNTPSWIGKRSHIEEKTFNRRELLNETKEKSWVKPISKRNDQEEEKISKTPINCFIEQDNVRLQQSTSHNLNKRGKNGNDNKSAPLSKIQANLLAESLKKKMVNPQNTAPNVRSPGVRERQGSQSSLKSWNSDTSHEKEEHKKEVNNISGIKSSLWKNSNMPTATSGSCPIKPLKNIPMGQKEDRTSFRPPTPVKPADLQKTFLQSRIRRTLPPDVYKRPPPPKPQKPPKVKLPGRETSLNKPSPSPLLREGPTPRKSSFLSQRTKETSVTPPNQWNLPSPPGRPEKPAGLSTIDNSISPALPDRPGKFGPGTPSTNNLDFPEPPAPQALRNLPPTPNEAPAMSPQHVFLPPTLIDDLYNDTADPPPLPSRPGPPPLEKMLSSEEIATWDDEEEADECVYDLTPEEMEYQKELHNSAKAVKKEEKKRKEAEKKEKEMRKKYDLPKEGDIFAESEGVVKCDAKGSGKDLAVRQNERIEIIRLNGNPKSKWLIRNSEGAYGYADPDNIAINMNQIRSTMQTVRQKTPGFSDIPHSPSATSHNDEEAVYDDTIEELYEEL